MVSKAIEAVLVPNRGRLARVAADGVRRVDEPATGGARALFAG